MAATDAETERVSEQQPRFPEELVDSTSFLLKRLGFAAKEQALAAYETSGLHPYHHAVLAVLDEGSRETQREIADALGYDRGQLVGLLDELQERGLVQRKRDPADRRRHIVQLTSEGRRALAKLRALGGRVDDDFLAPLDDGERARLHALLLALAQQHLPLCAGAAARRAETSAAR